MSIEETLAERGKTHGDWRKQSSLAQRIKGELMFESNWFELSEGHRESLDLITTKIARILCGNPDEKDHWKDIQGYAKLGEESCNEN